MNKNIISIDEQFLKANVEKDVCPLDWLAQFYREYPGKLVMVDKNLLSFLLNKARYDKLEASKHDGYKQSFTITWNATDKWPETRVVVSSYGRDEVKKDEKYNVNSDTNYYVIEELAADDILVDGMIYADNMKKDEQIIFLLSKQLEEEPEK